MTDEQKELLYDLLTKKVTFGLDEAEEHQLAEFDPEAVQMEFNSFEITAAAISMAGLENEEPMPSNLFAKILEAGEQIVGPTETETVPLNHEAVSTEREEKALSGSWFGWLGWVAAAAACVALAVNIWMPRSVPPLEVVKTTPTPEVKKVLSPAESREEMLRSATTLVKANWTSPDPKSPNTISGDVVWSEEKQMGYIRLRGLPVNDASATCYQLWIFDNTQDEKTPIDGGIFDIAADGEVVIPINAKLKAVGAKLFAITIERHGGVVVSKRDKMAAIAKVET